MEQHTIIADACDTPFPAHLDGDSTLVLVFASRATLERGEILERIRRGFPTSRIVGCSASGHFVGSRLDDDHAVVSVLRFEHTTLETASVAIDSPEQSFCAGRAIGNRLASPDLRAVLVVSDGTGCNGSALALGMNDAVGRDVTIFGGLAGDGESFERTVVVDDGSAVTGRVVAVGLFGDRVVVDTSSRGGWERFGPERTITASTGSTLCGLDGEPALDLYSRYLGERAAELPGSALLFPLTIRNPTDTDDHGTVRSVLGVDHDTKAMTFAGDVPRGWRAQLMRANFDALVDGAADAAEDLGALDGIVGDAVCLAVTCVGRRTVLGCRTEDELDAVVDVLDDVPLVGFYSYGELTSGRDGRCTLQNQTMTLTMIGET